MGKGRPVTFLFTALAGIVWLLLAATTPCSSASDGRVALVVGNAGYATDPLVNPANDARDLAVVLRGLEFDVIEKINVDKMSFLEALDLFYERLRHADVGFFYFAGHGVQINGHNYLLPSWTHITSESDVEFEAIDAERVLGKMRDAENSLNIMVLDACRNNPFPRTVRSAVLGFAQMDAPKGTIIAYATSPGAVAVDGKGRNSVYTKHLLEHIARSDLTIQEVFMETGLAVMEETQDKQIPWISSTPVPRYYLSGISAANRNNNGEYKQTPLPHKKHSGEDNTDSEPSRYFTNSVGMTFVYIPAGTFAMGSPVTETKRDPDENLHRVTLTRGLYMQTTEVTQGQWQTVMGNNPSHFSVCGDTCPVEMISWFECKEFIRKLNQREQTDMYRLSTEAEWEYACRAGTDQPFFFGPCLSSDQANYNGLFPIANCARGLYRKATMPVASFPPNAWGIYDLHGNVREWCADSCHFQHGIVTDTYRDGIEDPLCTDGSFRIKRGGDWYYGARRCRSADRDRGEPHSRSANCGFRLVATPP